MPCASRSGGLPPPPRHLVFHRPHLLFGFPAGGLQALHKTLQGQQAPALLSTQVTFIVEDCYALEEEAILDAFADAKRRAGRLARLLGLSLGEEVIAVSEEMSANQCRASSLADFISRAAFPLENNVAEVEAGAMLRVSFAIER